MSAESSSLGTRERSAVLRRAFLDSLPVLMGYVSMGLVAGVLLAAKAGLSHAALWGFLTSAFCVSGTYSFAIVQPVAERIPLAALAVIVVSVNFRYAFYGFTMLAKWKGLPFARKAFLVFMLTDENYALEAACRYQKASAHLLYCTAISAMNFAYWVGGVTVGAFSVSVLQSAIDPDVLRRHTNGMEFAMVALFLVILTDQLKGFAKNGK